MPFQRAPSSIENIGRMYGAAAQPMIQTNAMQPYRDKMLLLTAISNFMQEQQRKREIRHAEEAGGGPLGGGVGAGAGAIIGTMIAPGVGTAIGAGLGGQVGGAVGAAVDPPGGPAGAARASAYQQAYQATAPVVGGVVGGFTGGPGYSPHSGLDPTFGEGFGAMMQQQAPYYRAQQQYGPYGAMDWMNFVQQNTIPW